ncbi:helix-turn-helix domain-containing protein [Pantoea ananatis]|uniref:helix-turn-helix domain-containing protein n=1 Tax=Pantoea ananas TaxID=553 RepID=UPI002350D98E|nr:helix-turn-helix domain-containing protein [Pantoea ananatis]MDC7860680.1 transcriptional regulator [Pantoea ananatis]
MLEKPNVNLEKILTLFEKKGITKRKQASTMAEILNIQNNSAKQKLDGKRGITFSELKKIYSYFNEGLDTIRNYNGLFIVNDMHIRCNVEVSEEPLEIIEPDVNYAYKKGELYIINPTTYRVNKDMRKINKMELLPAPTLAVLDNDSEILELMESISNRYGISAKIFQRKEDMLEAVSKQTFDGYLIDWLLDYDETSEDVIRTIRQDNSKVPIMLLTGQLNHQEEQIAESILKYGVELIEKPTRVLIISSLLLAHLFY